MGESDEMKNRVLPSSGSGYLIDAAWIFLTGIVSLGYIIFRSRFAEFHIQFPFLDFPVFVGEIVLFLSGILLFFKWKFNPPALNRTGWLVIGYLSILLVKAFKGYGQWGALAFRDAALFYYPLFILFGYFFYNQAFFSKEKRLYMITLILIVFAIGNFDTYWVLTCFILSAVLIMPNLRSKEGYLFVALFFLFTPYIRFFYTSRMMFLGNLASLMFFITSLYLILPVQKSLKIKVAAFICLVFALGAVKYANAPSIKTLLRYDAIIKKFNYYEDIIRSRKNGFKMQEFEEVKLYNPDSSIVAQSNGAAVTLRDAPSGQSLEKKEILRDVSGNKSLMADKTLSATVTDDQSVPFQLSPMKKVRMSGDHLAGQMLNTAQQQMRQKTSLPISTDHVAGQIVAKIENELIWIEDSNVAKPEADSETADRSAANAVFRLLIWRDMVVDLVRAQPIFGFDFGKPLRSISLEILGWAKEEWGRDGWVAAHNSYLNIIYRMGIAGILLLGVIFALLFRMIMDFIAMKSVAGVLLCGIIVNWFVAAAFLLTFELPYTAIPLWSLFGMTLAYRDQKKQEAAGTIERRGT